MRTPNDIRLAEKVPEVNLKKNQIKREIVRFDCRSTIHCLGGSDIGRARSCLREKEGKPSMRIDDS